jgi:sec-independent protein translocase protein TatB
MSGIGFWELIILFLIGLIVLGPERLPRVANQLGSWLGQARRMTRVMKRQLEEELDLDSQFRIKPPPPAIPGNDEDDTSSPAHDADDIGTGVGDDAESDQDKLVVATDPASPDETADPGAGKDAS